jgi:hypothetical protein
LGGGFFREQAASKLYSAENKNAGKNDKMSNFKTCSKVFVFVTKFFLIFEF